jgi:cellulase
MLALHSAQTLGGAQFYIGCAQLKVTGSGSGTCGPTIEIPGAYKESDENIYIPKYYNGFDSTSYKAPGGPIASCGGSGAAPSTPTKPAAASASASVVAKVTPTPTQAAAPVKTPAASSAPVASSTPSPSSGTGNDDESTGALPTEFTLKTFITWLEGKAGNASKARRHARAF